MTDLPDALRTQAIACGNLDSPFMERLLTMLADNWPNDTTLAAKCATFQGDIGPSGDSLPLRIAGGLHALRLRGQPELEVIYPPHAPDDETFRLGILQALRDHDAFMTDWISSPPQTNELRRSAALIPAARLVAERFGLPIILSELGASGGLNLMWDRFALAANGWRVGPPDAVLTLEPDWDGPAPSGTDPVVVARRGVDLTPLNPGDAQDLLRLSAFLWPDQPQRLANTRVAAGAIAVQVDRGEAVDWLAQRLEEAPTGHVHLIQNTVAWQYFPKDAQERGQALMAATGANASEDRPLAWIQLETDGDQHGLGGAAITLQMWPTGEVQSLGRADFHGRWVKWHS